MVAVPPALPSINSVTSMPVRETSPGAASSHSSFPSVFGVAGFSTAPAAPVAKEKIFLAGGVWLRMSQSRNESASLTRWYGTDGPGGFRSSAMNPSGCSLTPSWTVPRTSGPAGTGASGSSAVSSASTVGGSAMRLSSPRSRRASFTRRGSPVASPQATHP